MKLRHIFLIGCIAVLSVVTYRVVTMNPKESAITDNVIQASATLSENSIVHNTPDKDVGKESEMQEKLDALRKEVALLKADIAALKQDMHSALQQTSSNAKATQATPTLTEEEQMAKEDEVYRKQAEDLETLFRQQTVDSAWSVQTKQMIQSVLANEKVDTNAIGIECRASMCRVEIPENISHGGSPRVSPKMQQFQIKIAKEFPDIMTSQIKEVDGSMTSVYYLSKEEFNLSDSSSIMQ